MSKIDLTQLIKILNLTQSDSDGEALSAIRMVNSRMKKAQISWEDLFLNFQHREKPKGDYKWKEAPMDFDYEFLYAMRHNDRFMQKLSQSQLTFFGSLIRYYNENQTLSEKQWEVVRSMWNKFREFDR